MLHIAHISKKLSAKQQEQKEVNEMKRLIIENDTMQDSLVTLVNSFCIRYRGCSIVLDNKRYNVLRSSFATLEEAKQGIDAALENFGKGFNKVTS